MASQTEIHDIDLGLLEPHGHIKTSMQNSVFGMTVTSANTIGHCKPWIKCAHYAEAPGRYRLPLKIDISANIDVPSLYVMLGDGHASFGVHSDNRRVDDICEPQHKINNFDSRLNLNEFNDISLIYDLNEMQILINGTERYYSKREKYMKSKLFNEMNTAGFTLRISSEKRTCFKIRSIRITEFGGGAGIIHTPEPTEDKPVPPAEKPNFDSCLSGLPDELRGAVADIDIWLRAMRPMNFKRQIGKYGDKITYVASEHGFSYALHIAGDKLYHTLQWYILTQGKPENWGRKADRMEYTLNYLSQSDPEFARRMWENLRECVGGYGPGCLARTTYTFAGERMDFCHGRMHFNMNLSEFSDVKRFIGSVNEIAGGGIKSEA